jgi:hypothetical protein
MFDPNRLGPETRKAWNVLVDSLADGQWHSWSDLVEAMVQASTLTAKSASNRVHEAVGVGILQRTGHHPHRAVRLVRP